MKSNPEIHLHSDFMKFFEENNIKNISWGSNGPDFYLEDFDTIGEAKREESKNMIKSAIKEVFDRKNKFEIHQYNAFFIITPEYIRVYTNFKDVYNWKELDIDNNIRFSINEKDAFLDYITNNCNKISVENHLEYILDLLMSNKVNLCIQDILTLILNLNSKFIFVKKGVYLNPNEENEIFIEIKEDDTLFEVKSLLSKFKITDINKVKEYIKHNYSSHLPDTKKSNLGKYYTPESLVLLVKKMLQPYTNINTIFMDIACGCGAFLELFDDCKIIGRDIDVQAVEVLNLLNFKNIAFDNSLVNVCREKYNLKNSDSIVIVGNPPYNDITSKNKRYGTNCKTSTNIEIDADIKSRDLGVSFLKAYAKLNPDYICVLHPLSYLIKESNFKNLQFFKDNYKLKEGIIFSSREFKDLSKTTEFPILVALYEKGNMDYEYIKNFNFKVLNDEKIFKLNNFKTIDGFIKKYPTKIDSNNIKKSDIDLYMYNIRDTNSLISSGNLQILDNTNNLNYITVMYEDLYKYAYLNCYKHLFNNNYIFGNLSPIVNQEELENNEYIRDLFIIGCILKNQRFSIFNIDNKNSIIYTKFLINDYKRKSKSLSSEVFNIYQSFINYTETKNEIYSEEIFNIIKEYFNNLCSSY